MPSLTQKNELTKIYTLLPDETKHSLGTRRESYKKMVYSDDLGLRSPVIQEIFSDER